MADQQPVDFRTRLHAALLAMQRQQATIARLEQAQRDPIAIIGMGCRFPGGADDPASFWRMLREGVDAIGEVPPDRWPVADHFHPDAEVPGKMATRWGGFLTDIDRFDARLFHISPREAVAMDPQQRLLLEVSWAALEDAALDPTRLAGMQAGVFVGLTALDYAKVIYRTDLTRLDAYCATGNVANVASGRLSYFYGLRGPSLTVDAACSSSLVAVHLACQSLKTGESDLALAAGVNLILAPDNTIAVSQARMLAPDGRCKTFDRSANGYARSEGCGVIVLKRLSQARADGDRVLAVIRGSAVRQDGARSGLTVPNGPAQEAVIRAALAAAELQPADVGFVEAHGTGTALGDPIEVEALGHVFGPGRPATRPLIVGALKTNVGHMESAAGIGGLIKAALLLAHGEIPRHLHLRELNPEIDLESIPAVVPAHHMEWPTDQERRIAGVSSFGSSGTIAHVVLEAADQPDVALSTHSASIRNSDGRPWLLPLSASSPAALADLSRRYMTYLAESRERFADVCHTAGVGRAHLAHRRAVVARDSDEARAGLRGRLDGDGAVTDRMPAVVFLCSGQGTAYAGMGRRLYDAAPSFRDAIDECGRLLDGHLRRPLRNLLVDDGPAIDDTDLAQPALFALEYAVAALWRAWGVTPTAVVGHSLGEYAAACLAGVFSLEDALRLVAARGRLMQERCVRGVMAAVFADERSCRDVLGATLSRVSLAAFNAPDETVIAGLADDVDRALAAFARSGVTARRLPGSNAFHSALVDPALPAFGAVLDTVAFRAPSLSLASNVTGGWATSDIAEASYWLRHAREPVCFAKCISRVAAAYPGAALLEIGPAATLLGLTRRCWPGEALYLPSLAPSRDGLEQMLESAGRLYESGHDLHWPALFSGGTRRKVSLPTYPFQRERFWPAPQADDVPAASTRAREASLEPGAFGGRVSTGSTAAGDRLRFGIMFFNGTEAADQKDNYRLLLEAARFADAQGFSSVWLPERHFTAFGSLYPNPATLHAALARETSRVRLMGGSVVMPLHHPLRVAEEWSVVDNLSGGRVGMSFASGWNPDDFALNPDAYGDRHDALFRGIEQVRRLWRGDTIEARGGRGDVRLRTYPAPVQPELPLWVTAASNPRTFERAGAIGANVLTHLLDQEVAELAAKIVAYRAARAAHGHDPGTGQVTVMLHTFLGHDMESVHAKVRAPFCRYLKENIHLLRGLAFHRGRDADITTLSPADLDGFVSFLYERFHCTRALLGTIDSCLPLVAQLDAIGVTEIACLLDFGPTADDVLESLPLMAQLAAHRLDRRGQPALARPFSPLHTQQARPVDKQPTRRPASALLAEAYEVQWPTVQPERLGAHSRRVRRTLVIGDRGGIGAALVPTLSAAGVAVRLGDPEALSSLVTSLSAVDDVVYLKALDEEEVSDPTPLLADVLRLVQAAATARGTPRLWLITRAAQQVGPSDLVAASQAAVWGLAKALPVEQPRLWGGLVDLEACVQTEVAANGLAEVLSAGILDDQLAIRQGRIHSARLARVPIEPAATAWSCRPDATYLITGGLRGIGLEAARWMAQRGARSLVLAGRTPVADTPAVKAVDGLRRDGVDVHTVVLDVTDRSAVAAFAEAERTQGRPPIRGVLHAAGVWADRPLVALTVSELTAVLGPKVIGTQALADSLPALDIFIAFSAFSALLPAGGQGNYAAANAFLDAFARARSGGHTRWISINWGPWSEVGFAATEYGSRAHQRLESVGITRIAPRDGFAVLDALAGSSHVSGVGIMPVDWQVLFDRDPNARLSPVLADLLARAGALTCDPGASRVRRLIDTLSGTDQLACVEREVIAMTASVVRLSPLDIGRHTSFADLGLDSLMAVELKNRIQHETGVDVALVTLLEGPSAAELSRLVLAHIRLTPLVDTHDAAGSLKEIEI